MVSKNSVIKDVRYVRLEPYQISNRWPLLRSALEEAYGASSAPPGHYANALAQLQSGVAQCWAVLTKHEKNPALVGLVFTRIEKGADCSKLYIVASKGYQSLHSSVYAEGLRVLEQFGKENGCNLIESITNMPRIGRILERAGWVKSELFRKEIA